MSIATQLEHLRKSDSSETHPMWDSKTRSYDRPYKSHAPYAKELFYENLQNEHDGSGDDYIDSLTSVLEARRQNALFKQREIERLQNETNEINARLRFERGHYEQWARSPVRRSNNSILYRGIQQLKARVVKDESDNLKVNDKKVSVSFSAYSKENDNKHYDNQASDQSVYQPHSCTLRRQRTADSGFSRYSSYGRSPLKVSNAVVHVLSERNDKQDTHQSQNRKVASSRSFDQTKTRLSALKFKDRCLFPLSINTPKCLEDNALVVNQPIRSSEIYRQKSKRKPDYRLKPLDSKSKSNDSAEESGDEMNAQGQISAPYFGSFAPRKLLATIRVADLYDVSHMGSHKSPPAELRYLDRQLTDPSITMKGSRVIKWVPNLQRTREKN